MAGGFAIVSSVFFPDLFLHVFLVFFLGIFPDLFDLAFFQLTLFNFLIIDCYSK